MRAPVLVIEAATAAGSVAILGDSVIAALDFGARDASGGRTEGAAPAVAAVLARAGLTAPELGAVVCDGGPGGFTSLRVAAAIAKGLCAPLQIPLYSVGSLELLAADAALDHPGEYTVAIPAGRSEWFASRVSVSEGGRRAVEPYELVRDELLRTRRHPLVGPGLELGRAPFAAAAQRLLSAVAATGPVSLATWEPDYGRLAEAQVRWEAAHGRGLPA